MILAGSTLPYWARYAIIFTGIICREEIFRIRKVHISLLAMRTWSEVAGCCRYPSFPLSASSFASSSMAFRPAGVQAHPRPKILAGVKLGLKILGFSWALITIWYIIFLSPYYFYSIFTRLLYSPNKFICQFFDNSSTLRHRGVRCCVYKNIHWLIYNRQYFSKNTIIDYVLYK